MRQANLRWIFEAQPESVHPNFVLEDSGGVLVLFEPGGSLAMHTERPKGGPRGRNLVSGTPNAGFHEIEWTGEGVVRVHREGEPWSVWRWISAEGEWSPYFYVNLERSWTRTPTGFDTQDWILDIVVGSDLSWRYKDEDEFEWARVTGQYDDLRIEQVRSAAAEVIERIEHRGWPFDANWDAWKPDLSLPAPVLLPGWDQ